MQGMGVQCKVWVLPLKLVLRIISMMKKKREKNKIIRAVQNGTNVILLECCNCFIFHECGWLCTIEQTDSALYNN